MIEFFQTQMGHKFYESDVPRIASALERIADRLEILVNNMEAAPERDKTDKEGWRARAGMPPIEP